MTVIRRWFAIHSNGRIFRKPLLSASQAAASIKSGATLLVGGFGLTGIPEKMLKALAKRNVTDLKIVSNDTGTEDFGIGPLIREGKVSKVTASYIGENRQCVKDYLEGKLEIDLVPQNTLSWNGHDYLQEHARTGDVALIKAWKGDEFGNLVFRETARNFNPVMAKAARTTLVEVEELVPTGAIDPDEIHLPGIYVDGMVLGGKYEKQIMHLTVSRDGDAEKETPKGTMPPREKIARRAAKEFRTGMYVAPKEKTLTIGTLSKARRGRPRLGECWKGDGDCLRRGHFDMSMLGAFEVSEFGDLANWIIPGKIVKGMGGAMDLANSGSTIIVTMTHLSKDGRPKIVSKCSLPLTAPKCVKRIITELAVFDVHPQKGLTLVEKVSSETIDSLRSKTGCPFTVAPKLGTF
ncbi:Succinyl-CoA:3-ketoacid-coenzyme A transferase [Paramicrosporidium saccamoebae]|uniref:Succinyl-CoA:3-ketoacid-coenzyme A transferase n=1 Tax=Paramicrosporidium saccamoebae TaxID=1246581 RepID=A0A2H9TNE2_9FUNG|nr:Succinyl-CoA:3-ketoacid-coenzyme A transferase [Paramicrosporidium saccamoebae]